MSLSDEIRARHKPSGFTGFCVGCQQPYAPCDAIRAAEELDRLRGEDYRCETMCEAAHYGGGCRCVALSENVALRAREGKE